MDLGVGPRTSLYSCVCGSVVHVSCDNFPQFSASRVEKSTEKKEERKADLGGSFLFARMYSALFCCSLFEHSTRLLSHGHNNNLSPECNMSGIYMSYRHHPTVRPQRWLLFPCKSHRTSAFPPEKAGLPLNLISACGWINFSTAKCVCLSEISIQIHLKSVEGIIHKYIMLF